MILREKENCVLLAPNDFFDVWSQLPDVPFGPCPSLGSLSEEPSPPSPACVRGSLAAVARRVRAIALPFTLESHRFESSFSP